MVYSYSKISTYDGCPRRYKFSYIDKAKKDFENTIESLMGTIVHECLEKLYKDLKYEKLNSLSDLLKYYKKEWDKRSDLVRIIRDDLSKKNYYNMGIKYITNYYNRLKPFNQEFTIDLETNVSVDLYNDGQYKFVGIIDRLSIRDGVYIINDYKTSSTLPTINDIKNNKQLSLYALAIKEKYHDVERVELVWHYLAFDKEIRVEIDVFDASKIKEDLKNKIDLIESDNDFLPRESSLCNWCEYFSICPVKKHLAITNKLNLNDFNLDQGVVYASKYFDLISKKNEIDKNIKDLEKDIYKFCKLNDLLALRGKNSELKLFEFNSYETPIKNSNKYNDLKRIVKDNFEDLIIIDSYSLSKLLNNMSDSDKTKKEILKYLVEKKNFRIYCK